MGIWIIFIMVGGLLFIYFNFRVFFKFNLATSFIKIYINLKLFRKEYTKDKKFYYIELVKKSSDEINKYKAIKTKKYFPYLKYFKKVTRLFIIKNIHFYPECLDNSSSFVVEFMIVNNIIKRPLLKG